jgi:hypothetical protein
MPTGAMAGSLTSATRFTTLQLLGLSLVSLADGVLIPAGKTRLEAYLAQYDALAKSTESASHPAGAVPRLRAPEMDSCDSLLEIVGSTLGLSPTRWLSANDFAQDRPR